MDILFLDIDGVLNRRGTKERCGHYVGVDRELAKRLTDWLKETDVKIVLSSTWRKHPDMWDHLHVNGIYWIDKTPYIGEARGVEINAWLMANMGKWKRYAVLDDDRGVLPTICSDMFVQTDEDIGVQDEHIEMLTALFSADAVTITGQSTIRKAFPS